MINKELRYVLSATDGASPVFAKAAANAETAAKRFRRASSEFSARAMSGEPLSAAMASSAADETAFARFLKDQRNNSGLRGLLLGAKHELGKGSTAGMALKLLSLGGPVAAAGVASHYIQGGAEALGDAARGYLSGEKTGFDTLTAGARSFPFVKMWDEVTFGARDAAAAIAKALGASKSWVDWLRSDKSALAELNAEIKAGEEHLEQMGKQQAALRGLLGMAGGIHATYAATFSGDPLAVGRLGIQQNLGTTIDKLKADFAASGSQNTSRLRQAIEEAIQTSLVEEFQRAGQDSEQALQEARRKVLEAVEQRAARELDYQRKLSDYEERMRSIREEEQHRGQMFGRLRASMSADPDAAMIEQQYREDRSSDDPTTQRLAGVRRDAAQENLRYSRAMSAARAGRTVEAVSITGRYSGSAEQAAAAAQGEMLQIQREHRDKLDKIIAALDRIAAANISKAEAAGMQLIPLGLGVL